MLDAADQPGEPEPPTPWPTRSVSSVRLLQARALSCRFTSLMLRRCYTDRISYATVTEEHAMESEMLDVSLHERRRSHRMEDREYQAAYERAAREIAQTDEVIQALDELRMDLGVSKAELARRVNRNASSVRRLFTASRPRPELPLIIALADALGAELRIVPRTPQARAAVRKHAAQPCVASTA